jgi:endonuclease-8
MNQKIISGIGAYLRSEILYLAGVNPFKKIKLISVDKLERIYKAMKLILKLAYKCNGTSIEFYKDIDSHKGRYDKYLMVYGNDKDAEGNEIKKGLLDKRNIYWVPGIQL